MVIIERDTPCVDVVQPVDLRGVTRIDDGQRSRVKIELETQEKTLNVANHIQEPRKRL